MREIYFYTILFLFCFVPLAAQEVAFEGLHLDDLISVPGKVKPGTFNSSVSFSFALPDFKTLSPNHSFVPDVSKFKLSGLALLYLTETHRVQSLSFWKPAQSFTLVGDYFSSSALPVETFSAYTVRSNAEVNYKLTGKAAIYFSTSYVSDRYRTPRSLYTMGVSGGLTFQLSEHFRLKSGVYYQYNTVFRQWEWSCLAGFIYCF